MTGIDYQILMWVLLLIASGIAYMIGKSHSERQTNEVIYTTITILIEKGFLMTKIEDGEEVVVRVNEQ